MILPTEDVKEFKPAPSVASFSARGPGGLTESVLKPDLMAPGVSILAAAMPSTDKADVPAGRKPSAFAIKSGTSMACPHVAGAGAFVKSAHPGWSPSMIRSALMTTGINVPKSVFNQSSHKAKQLDRLSFAFLTKTTLPAATTTNNLGKPVTSSTGAVATGHDMGAGEISPLRALSPGLVFDTTTKDYLNFLCYYGYKAKLVRMVSGDAGFACPHGAPSQDLIATGLNYPSISVPRLASGKPVAVSRTAMNVGPSNATYQASVEAPLGLSVKVSPELLVFSKRWASAAYQVTFARAAGVS